MLFACIYRFFFVSLYHQRNIIHPLKLLVMDTEKKVFVEIEYKDGTSFSFDVILHSERESAKMADILMITRGTLMASSGCEATAYNSEGFPIARYVK